MNADLVSAAMMETDIAAGDDERRGHRDDRKNARDARFSGSRR